MLSGLVRQCKKFVSGLRCWLPAVCGALFFAFAWAPVEAQTDPEKPLVLVAGITGQMGGAVAEELLSRGFPLRGFSRDISQPKALDWINAGVEMVQGDFHDPESILRATKGVYGFYMVMPSGISEEDDLAFGLVSIDAAVKNNVQHMVLSTSVSSNPENGMTEDSTTRVAIALRSSGLPWSTIRPSPLMQNFIRDEARIIEQGYRNPREADDPMQFTDLLDMAFLVGEMFDNPEEWIGRGQTIISDELTGADVATALSNASGKNVEYVQISFDELRPGAAEWTEWAMRQDFGPVIDELQERYPDRFHSLPEFLERVNWGRE